MQKERKKEKEKTAHNATDVELKALAWYKDILQGAAECWFLLNTAFSENKMNSNVNPPSDDDNVICFN